MNSKSKGNIGEAMILAEFTKRNIQVSLPFGDNARYDMIADFNGKLNKIQVKYSSQLSENDSYICHTSSSTNHTTNKHMDKYTNQVDYIAIYISPWNESVLIPIQDCDKNCICLRKEIGKNNQQKGIHLLSDYSFDKILCVETLHDDSKLSNEHE